LRCLSCIIVLSLNDVISLATYEVRSCCFCIEEVEAKTVIVTAMIGTENVNAVVTETSAEAVHRVTTSRGTAVDPDHHTATLKMTDDSDDVQARQFRANGKLFSMHR